MAALPIKKIHFDLFQLDMPEDEDRTFTEILEEQDRVCDPIQQFGSPILKTDRFRIGRKYVAGTLRHNQMNDIPSALDINTLQETNLPINNSQGLAFSSSFLWDKELNMLMYEVNKNGVTLNSFCKFFELNYSISKIGTSYVINPSDMESLNNMTDIRKFSVKIARIENGQIFYNTRQSFKRITKSADQTNASTLDYTLSASWGDSLRSGVIKRFVRDFVRYKDDGEVTKLLVTGREGDEGELETLDFLKNRVRFKIETERTRFANSLTLVHKYREMEHEYEGKRPDLLRAYRRRNEND